MTRTAVFDLDGTLYRATTMYDYLEAVHRRWAPARAVLLRSGVTRPWRQAWRVVERALRRDVFREVALRSIAGMPYETLVRDLDDYVARLSTAAIAPVMERLERHRQDGDRLLLASATLAPIAERIAERLTFDGVVASRPEVVDGTCSGRWEDDVRGRKLAALQERFGALEDFVVVTDNLDDGDLIAEARHATAVVGPGTARLWIERFGTRVELLEVVP